MASLNIAHFPHFPLQDTNGGPGYEHEQEMADPVTTPVTAPPSQNRRRHAAAAARRLRFTEAWMLLLAEGRPPGRTAHLWFVVVLALEAVVVRALHERA